MRVSIATKVFIAFTTTVVVFVGILGFSLYRVQSLYDDIEHLNQTVLPLTLQLTELQSDVQNLSTVLSERDPVVLKRTLQVSQFIYSFPKQFRTDLEKILGPLPESLEGSVARRDIEAVRTDLSNLRQQSQTFNSKLKELTELVTSGDQPPSRQKLRPLRTDIRRRANNLGREIETLRTKLRNTAHQSLARANQRYKYNLYALFGLTCLALLIASGLLYSLISSLRPLRTLSQTLRRVGEGEYIQVDPPETWGEDEISVLTREFNSMIDQLRARDEKLQEQQDKLIESERLATIGEMTSLITHELRNPLSSINLNVELLRDALSEGRQPGEANGEVGELIETVVNEVDRLRRTTEEYLVYAKLPTPRFEQADVVEVLDALIEFHRAEWSKAGIEVVPEFDADSQISVSIDSDQLHQALLNIAQNAADVTPEGKRIFFEVEDAETEVVITVRDEGPGLPEQQHEQIFEAFYTTKSKGSGLGLAMAQQIIEEHDGHIDAYNDPSGGAVFQIHIPRSSPDE